MPRYDFQCKACGEIFEETRSFATATDPAGCPACGRPAPRLLRMPIVLYGGSVAPDPATETTANATEDDQPLDPTKPHAAWRALGDGCPCCPGGRHIAPQRARVADKTL